MWGEKTNESVVKFLKELYDRGKSEDEVVLNVFSVVLGASVEYAQGVLRSLHQVAVIQGN